MENKQQQNPALPGSELVGENDEKRLQIESS